MTGPSEPGTPETTISETGSADPAVVSNPPGLPQIAYRAGDFATFRRALLSPLPGEQQLSGWSPGAGDLGLQALEWWAYLADILTFYNERIANGSYLGTAVAAPGPQQAAGLAMLLGYLTAPALTATGVVAAIRDAGSSDAPLVLPAGLQIASTPTPGAPAQQFEVTEARTFTGPSDAIIGLPANPALFGQGSGQPPVGDARGTGQAEQAEQAVLLSGQLSVSPGDQFILVNRAWDGTTADWAVTTPRSAITEQSPDGQANTRLTLRSADWHALAADQSSNPPPGAPLAADYHLRRPQVTAQLWTMTATVSQPPASPRTSTAPGTSTADPTVQTLTVPLASLARDLSYGDNVLFAGSTGGTAPRSIALLAQVTGYTEEITRVPATMAPGRRAATSPDAYVSHAFLTVQTAGADDDVAALRSVLATSAPGSVVLRYRFSDFGTPVPTPATVLDRLPATVTLPVAMPLPVGPVALEDANGTGLLVTAAGTPGSVTLTPADGSAAGPLSPPLRAPVRLLADLVPVSRGTSVVAETLGDGDPAAASQAFALQYSPLIYLPPAQPGGPPVSTLSVSVNGTAWQEVRTFSGQRRDATVYVVSELPDGTVRVGFGDGVNGSRLPPGAGNVTAAYRYGAPAPAPPPGSLATVLQPQPNLGSVRSPVGITPGTAPETAAQTAAAAPATVVLLPGATSSSPPLISLADAERLAATVTGVTRARAYWTWDQELRRPAVTVYVGSSAAPAVVTAVGMLLRQGTPRIPMRAAPALGIALAVECRLLCSAGTSQDTVLAAASDALTSSGGLFSPGQMAIGQRLYRSQLENALTAGGLASVLSLTVHPLTVHPLTVHPEHRMGADPSGEHALDPGQGCYYSLSPADLSISVVTG